MRTLAVAIVAFELGFNAHSLSTFVRVRILWRFSKDLDTRLSCEDLGQWNIYGRVTDEELRAAGIALASESDLDLEES